MSGIREPGRVHDAVRTTRHRKGPYRSRRGMIFGVCRGLAEHFEVSVFWTRFAVVLIFFFSGLWPIAGIYLLAGFLMPPAPVKPFVTEADEEFYSSYTRSRSMALHRLKRTYDRLSRRIQRMEHVVTGAEYDWDRRMREP